MSTERLRRAPSPDGLWIVGLVGRTGSGKSTFARLAAERGAVVIDADRIGHEVTDADPEVRAAMIEDYGPAIYLDDGSLDRRAVARRVFTDSVARERLDRLVHPRIAAHIAARLQQLRDRGYRGLVVIDAALLLDWGLERACDAVVAVVAQERERIERQMRARGWSELEARQRLGAQRSDEAFIAAADVAVHNAGEGRAQFEARALETLEALEARRVHNDTTRRENPC
jgi:dephospho-CoA kinase